MYSDFMTDYAGWPLWRSFRENLIILVLEAFKPRRDIENIFVWSGSTVALTWVKSQQYELKLLVANRGIFRIVFPLTVL